MAEVSAKAQAEIDAEALKAARIRTRREEIGLEKDQREIEQYEARQREVQRKRDQTQTAMRQELWNKRSLILRCNHRQGGPLSGEGRFEGTGHSALTVATMPDGFTLRVYCPICGMETFNPHPNDAIAVCRDGETKQAMQERVATYNADLEAFQALLKHAKDKHTPEAAAMMDCGNTFVVRDGATNQIILPRRPHEQYPIAN